MPRDYVFFVYFMASISKVIYIGVTNNLEKRVYEHKHEMIPGFSKKYKCKKLVYCEDFDYVNDAIARERQLKGWSRKKKIALIEKENPYWNDLSKNWFKEE